MVDLCRTFFWGGGGVQDYEAVKFFLFSWLIQVNFDQCCKVPL